MRLFRLASKPIGIVFAYLLIGLLWITTSDQIAYLWFGEDTMQLTSVQLLKGVFFILITSLILYFLVNNLYNRLATFKDDLNSIYTNPALSYLKLNSDGKVKYASDSFYDIMQLNRYEIVGQSIFELLDSNKSDFIEKLQQNLDSKKSTFRFQSLLSSKKGNEVWVEVFGAIKSHAFDNYLLSIHDISEMKSVQKAHDQELREKDALINNTEDFIFSVNKELCLVSFNDSFRYAYQNLTGSNPKKGDSVITEDIPEKERIKWKKYYLEALSGKDIRSTEKITTTVDKSVILQVHFYPIKVQNEIVGVSVYGRNVTEILEARRKLGEKEAYLEVIANHANEAIFACDQSGQLQYANQKLKELLDDPVVEKDLSVWPDIYHLYVRNGSERIDHKDMPIYQSFLKGKIDGIEFTIRQPGKDIIFIRASGSALWNKKGEKIGAMVIWSDITAQVDREIHLSNATLEALEKERADISSELHDSITQLLGVVNMNLKNLALDYPDVKQNARFGIAQKELENAIEETRNAAYRIMPKSIKDFGLIPALKELISDISHSDQLDIELEYNEDKRLDDETELNVFRIAQETLNNILQHSQATEVRVKLNFDEQNVSLIIEENGRGYNPNDPKNGLGIRNMRNRANKLNGSFEIQQLEEAGMKTILQIPQNSE